MDGAAIGARVRVVEIQESRRRRLAGLGLDVAAEPAEDADLVVDTVGAAATRQAALARLAPGGTAVFVGLHDNESALSFYQVILQERRIQGAFCYTDAEFRDAVGQVAQVPDAFCTRLPLEAGPRAFEDLVRGAATHLKVLLEPGPSPGAPHYFPAVETGGATGAPFL